MAEKTEKDSTDGWRDLISQWEKGINALANTTMNSDEFSSGVNGSMNVALRAQQAMGAAMGTYLATLNLPSRADVTAISDRLASIEAMLERIALRLEASAPAPSTTSRPTPNARIRKAPKPRRTKRPPGEPTS